MDNIELLEIIDGVAPQVAEEVEKVARNVYKYTYQERLSNKDLLGSVKTSIFEVLFRHPHLRDNELIKEAVKNYKYNLWSKGTVRYDEIRRATPSKSRDKIFAGMNRLPWGAEVYAFEKGIGYAPVNISYIDDITDQPSLSSESIFNKLKEFAGPEIATIFVLHHGFNMPVLALVKELIDLPEQTEEELNRVYRRVMRIMDKMAKILPNELGDKLMTE